MSLSKESEFPSDMFRKISNFVTISDDSSHGKSKNQPPESGLRPASVCPMTFQTTVPATHMPKNGLVHSSDVNMEPEDNKDFIFADRTLEKILESLRKNNDSLLRSERFITLAEIGKPDSFVAELRVDDHFAQMREFMKFKSSDTSMLLFCKALALCSITRQRLAIAEAKSVEFFLMEYFRALNSVTRGKPGYEISLHMLPKLLQNRSLPLCEDISPSGIFNIRKVNVTYLCFKSLHNICSQTSEFLEPDFFSSSTVFEILEKFHALLMSPIFSSNFNLCAAKGSYDFQIVTLHLCLQIFESIFFQNPRKQTDVLNYRDNLFLKCMGRLLAFCMKALFKKDSDSAQSADDIDFEKKISVVSKHVYLHQTCLVSALKVLLSVYPNYGSNVREITSTLMEKLLICFLETSYSNLECKFELCLMALELMVNLTEFEVIDRKQFAKLCLMKFNIGNFTYLTVEILIKILICSLKRIIALGSIKKPENLQGVPPDRVINDSAFNAVYHVAEEHMEHSFICSYICVYLSYFCDMKQPFFTYVCERLPVEMAEASIVVMGKFKEFIPLMGKQNAQAFSMLDRAICIFLGMVKQGAALPTAFEIETLDE